MRSDDLAAGDDPRWEASDWWYLAFLVMLVFQPVFAPDTGVFQWAVTGASIAVFVPLFLYTARTPGPIRRHSPTWATILGLVATPVNGGATAYFVYAAAFAAGHRPRTVAFRWFTGLSIVTLAMAFVVPIGMPAGLFFFAVPILFIWVVGMMVLDDTSRTEEAERLRIDNARIEHLATASERERISRDLHDLLGHALTETIVRAQVIQRLAATDPERVRSQAGEVEQASRRALDEVRMAVRGWRRMDLDDEIHTAERTLKVADITLDVQRDDAFDPAPTAETALSLALRESITNIVRHAGASRCHLVLSRRDGHDVLEITDDGNGADIREGGGLRGMRERIASLGGTVECRTGDGTELTVRVPRGASG